MVGFSSERDCSFCGDGALFDFRIAVSCSDVIWTTGIVALVNLELVVLLSFLPLSCEGGVTTMSAVAPCSAASLALAVMLEYFVQDFSAQMLLPSFCGS